MERPETESVTHSFIVSVSLEEELEPGKPGVWHGQIIHLPGDEWEYLTELESIPAFISNFLGKGCSSIVFR
jgi:hypothetical protein